MEYFDTPAKARRWCNLKRKAGMSIGYVPTMGALHDGHLSLVNRSLQENDHTVVSIFVNPLQFNHDEDLSSYPMTMEADLGMLEQAGCDLVYSGELSDFFPEISPETAMQIDRPCRAIAGLEAKFRPGHLEGVQAIVNRLFDVVGSCKSYFGEKDFQQTLVVNELAQRKGNVEVIVCPTIRESDGLAMSSRNRRMNRTQRGQAVILFSALSAANRLWNDGVRDPYVIEAAMREIVNDEGAIKLEYAEIRDPFNWSANTPHLPINQAQALIAAYLGDIRLIDNCRLGALLQ